MRHPPTTLIDLVGPVHAENISAEVTAKLDAAIRSAPKDESIGIGLNYTQYYNAECMRIYTQRYKK